MKWTRVGVVLVVSCGGRAGAQSACAASPAAAIEAHRSGAPTSATTGYRVEAVRWDATQGQRWAIIRSCDHAERPTLAMLTDLPLLPAAGRLVNATAAGPIAAVAGAATTAPSVPAGPTVVHAGETVRLWRVDGLASIEMLATAEENGVAGGRVRVRLVRAHDANGQPIPGAQLFGVVRGAGDVEIEP